MDENERRFPKLTPEELEKVVSSVKQMQDEGYTARSPRESLLGIPFDSDTFKFFIPGIVPPDFVTYSLDSMDCLLTAACANIGGLSCRQSQLPEWLVAQCWMERKKDETAELLLAVVGRNDDGSECNMKHFINVNVILGAMRSLLEHKEITPDYIFSRIAETPTVSFDYPGKMLAKHGGSLIDGFSAGKPAAELRVRLNGETRTRAAQVLKLVRMRTGDSPLFMRAH